VSTAEERGARLAGVGYDYSAVELEIVRACNLCGSSHTVEVSRRDRYGYPAVLHVCTSCGLGFLSPRPTAAEYRAFYVDVYRPLVSAYHGRLIDAETVQLEQRVYADQLVAFLRAQLEHAPANVLDIGGSTGVVAEAIVAAFGSAATVLDPAPDELAIAAAAGMGTIEGVAEDFDAGETRWQLVLLCQTIDHLTDVAATLAALRQLLTDDGHAFADVLDIEFVVARQGAIEQAVKIDHPHYLTRATACAYFALAGLELVAERMSDDGHWGFLLAPGAPSEPDWEALERRAIAFLEGVWRLRATS
jgi:SAM-dependent methyltransferase